VGEGNGVPVELGHVTAAEEKEEKGGGGGGSGGSQHDARWLERLQSAVSVEGGTLKCSVSARPDPARGVRAVNVNWRRGRDMEMERERAREGERDRGRGGDAEGDAGDAEALSNILGLPTNPSDGPIHPVLQALLERKRIGSLPGARSDGMRIGLAVEGGGMKGVISAAMCGEVRLGGYCSPRHPMHFQPSSLEMNGIL